MKMPIACSLSATDASDRVQEWRVALRAAVKEVSRPAPARTELHLVAEPSAIGTLVDLAQREKACCEFFGFAFEVDVDEVRLVISVPDNAVEVLDDFAALAHSVQGEQAG